MSGIRKFIGLLFFFSILFNEVNSQTYYELDRKPSQLKSAAKHSERKADPYTTIAYLEKYNSINPENSKTALKLGHVYHETRDYQMAEQWYRRSFEMDKEKNLIAAYYQAQMLMCLGNYDEASIVLRYFRKKYKVRKDEKYYRKMSKILLQGCELAKTDSIDLKGVYVSHLEGVNFAYNEISPYPLSSDQLVYASMQFDTVIHYEDSVFKDSSIYHMRLFKATKNGQEWRQNGPIQGPFNHASFDVGNLTVSPDGNKIYFNRCKKNWKYKNICHLYVSHYTEETWSEPVKLNKSINQKNYTSTQPSIGIHPKYGHEILYFSSDRPDGRGGLDIWYSEFKKGVFSEPKNCGGKINSIGDEVTPFYDNETNTLYFSSNAYPGYGGLDIYKSFGNKSKWISMPENLKKPFNSQADDLYYNFGQDPKGGYLTSNREGGIALKNPTCCDDIYKFEYDELRIFTYRAVVKSDSKDELHKISSGEVEVFLRDTETGDTTLVKSVEINQNGEVSFKVQRGLNYLLLINSKGHFKRTLEIPRDKNKRDYNQIDTIILHQITKEAIVLKNIYYDFDEWTLTKKAENAIDSFLLEVLILNPAIKVELSSHTDAKGSDVYNIKLSQKRAESVVSYLRRKGISRGRMIAKGYGKTRPIAPNKNPDGSDNPEGRQMNRRCEFRVVGYQTLKH